jgi:hypothetical protein
MLSYATRIMNLSGHGRLWVLGRAAVLGLLSLAGACGRDVTAPVGQLGGQATGASLSPFDATGYFPIDVQRAARQQYGSSAKAIQVSRHLYGWAAKLGGHRYPIDMARAVRDQYGPDYILGAVGVGVYDWRAVHWSALSGEVLPVMPIASDYFFNVDSVAWGLANLESVSVTIRNWYALRVGKTFRLLPPLVVFVPSSRTAAQWNALSYSTTDSQHRYDFLYAADSEYRRTYPEPGSSLRVVIVPFSGSSPDVWLGAADQAVYAVIPPRASSIMCPAVGPLDSRCSDATYAIGHELGHGFGLAHACDIYPGAPNCQYSIMQTGKPWDAILLPGEISSLQASPFFIAAK